MPYNMISGDRFTSAGIWYDFQGEYQLIRPAEINACLGKKLTPGRNGALSKEEVDRMVTEAVESTTAKMREFYQDNWLKSQRKAEHRAWRSDQNVIKFRRYLDHVDPHWREKIK